MTGCYPPFAWAVNQLIIKLTQSLSWAGMTTSCTWPELSMATGHPAPIQILTNYARRCMLFNFSVGRLLKYVFKKIFYHSTFLFVFRFSDFSDQITLIESILVNLFTYALICSSVCPSSGKSWTLEALNFIFRFETIFQKILLWRHRNLQKLQREYSSTPAVNYSSACYHLIWFR